MANETEDEQIDVIDINKYHKSYQKIPDQKKPEERILMLSKLSHNEFCQEPIELSSRLCSSQNRPRDLDITAPRVVSLHKDNLL